MTQDEIERISTKIETIFTELENRIMQDIVRRLKENNFASASVDWQISRLQQLGIAEEEMRKYIRNALKKSDEEIDRIFSDEVYKQYYGHEHAYKFAGMKQIPFGENIILQQMIEAAKKQINGEYKNLAGSMGFAIRDKATGKITSSPLMEFYRKTMDAAVMDIKSGAFDYNTVLKRTVAQMADSGVRFIDYDSGRRERVDVAARRAVLTGFRQVQGKINEQVAEELGTDMYEVSYHRGARPDHQPWQGKVWTMQQLIDVCGLGTGPGLLGWNCYHDYKPFPPGSIRTYTDDELQKMLEEENTPKEYNGKKYTMYEALQQQRKMERNMRAQRQKINLLKYGEADPNEVILAKAKYQGQMQTYKDFSEKMGLKEQKDRIMQDGLKGKFMPTRVENKKLIEMSEQQAAIRERQARQSRFSERFTEFNNGQKDTIAIRRLMNNLNKTNIGKETVSYIAEHPELNIQMCYKIDHDPGVRGYQDGNDIYIFASETRTVQKTAETIVHEITHHRYDIGDSQWAECVCFAQETKHRTGKEALTGAELKNIIRTVKELYPELPWR